MDDAVDAGKDVGQRVDAKDRVALPEHPQAVVPPVPEVIVRKVVVDIVLAVVAQVVDGRHDAVVAQVIGKAHLRKAGEHRATAPRSRDAEDDIVGADGRRVFVERRRAHVEVRRRVLYPRNLGSTGRVALPRAFREVFHEQVVSQVLVRREGDALPVGEPPRIEDAAQRVGDHLIAPRGDIVREGVVDAGAVGDVHQPLRVGRDVGLEVVALPVHQHRARSRVQVDSVYAVSLPVDGPLAVVVGGKHDEAPVGREGRIALAEAVVGEAPQRVLLGIVEIQVGGQVVLPYERDRLPVLRQVRIPDRAEGQLRFAEHVSALGIDLEDHVPAVGLRHEAYPPAVGAPREVVAEKVHALEARGGVAAQDGAHPSLLRLFSPLPLLLHVDQRDIGVNVPVGEVRYFFCVGRDGGRDVETAFRVQMKRDLFALLLVEIAPRHHGVVALFIEPDPFQIELLQRFAGARPDRLLEIHVARVAEELADRLPAIPLLEKVEERLALLVKEVGAFHAVACQVHQ